MKVENLESIRIKIASPDDILKWSHGEVLKPETINYRNQKPEKDGLFCEKIFGPEKDYECYCGKYRKIRYKGIICDRCGVEVTKSSVRRERMGHIKLACPVSHIWFLRGIPSRIGMVLDISMQKLEKVIYFAAFIITSVDEEAKKRIMKEIEKEYNQKVKMIEGEKKNKEEMTELKNQKTKAQEDVSNIKELRIMSEAEYYDLSFKYGEIFEAETGAEALRKIFEKAKLSTLINETKKKLETISPLEKVKTLRRLKFLEGMKRANIRPEWMFLTVLPVLPPDLRPIVQLDGGRYASSDLNDLYRRVINRNNRLKYLLEINAPSVIVRNEKRMLQEAVDALIDNEMRKRVTTQATTGGRRLLKSLADMLKGKQGRFRQNLLGKRVDYSGRSVIVVGPNLQLYQCGIPKKMALELFKPFVINKILQRELAYNVRGATRLIEEEIDEVWAMLEEVVEDKVVLLNRAPTLHRLGIQAFKPILIEENVIRIHPLVCSAFNADFDGDQMAVHLPLSAEAQKEASEIMLSSLNLLKPATGQPVVTPTRDIVLGCYWITKIEEGKKGEGKLFGSPEEAIISHEYGYTDIKANIKVRVKDEIIDTSVGRILFNKVFPEDYPFQNYLVDSKALRKITRKVIENYTGEEAQEVLDKIKNLGFEYATISGVSWGMKDLVIPKEKKTIIENSEKEIEKTEEFYKKGLLSKEEKTEKNIKIWHQAKQEIEKLIPKTLPGDGSVFAIVDSGSRGSWSQPVQMAGMKGLVANPAGQTIELPVKSSFKEGFGVLEYFISTHGARKGTVDTALKTSTAGYLTRRLVDVAHEIIVEKKSCGDTKGMEILKSEADSIDQDMSFKIVGRVTLEDIKSGNKILVKKGELISWELANKIIDAGIEKVRVRTPLTCTLSEGVCQQCYGWDFGTNDLVKVGEAVGVVAAQAIGEPGTQLTMRTFHTGGVAGGGDITVGLPRIQEIFEVRTPGGKAEISKVEGKVVEITPDGTIKIETTKKGDKKKNIVEYQIPPKSDVLVKKDQKVNKGDVLSAGSLDLKDVFKFKGAEETQRYILKEVQNIYVSQGVNVHDKHIEVIIRQMFSRVKIKDAGDSFFTPGEVVEKRIIEQANKELKKEGKKLAVVTPVLLGISKVALTTDSFLSAASFQETSRILIESSLSGKVDELRGLKENVIIGKLIPAGTGFSEKNKE